MMVHPPRTASRRLKHPTRERGQKKVQKKIQKHLLMVALHLKLVISRDWKSRMR